MVIHLDSRAERLIEEQINTGRFHSPEELVARALETLASSRQPRRNMAEQEQAVQNMIDLES